jgi:septal ring factor EnvC (AmiA/AmiB activator)
LPANADATANAPSVTAILVLKSEIDASRQNTTALRQNVAAISKSLSMTTQALQQLQQSQVELHAQLEEHDLLLVASEKQTAAIESAYADVLASSLRHSADVTQQQKQSLQVKLQRHRELLATSLQLLDQVNAPIDSQKFDADLQRTQQIVLELAQELRNRVEEVTSRLDAMDGQPATRASLVDAQR